MRKLINLVWMALLLAGSLDSNAQGLVRFSNLSETLVTNFFTGQPVEAGTTFLAGLYYAPDGITTESVFFQIGPPASFVGPGRFFGGIEITPNTTPPLGYAMLQVRVWESAFGSSYEEAVIAPPMSGRVALTGRSNVFRYRTECGDCVPNPPPQALEAYGFRGFYVIPEPQILNLGLLGAGIVLQLFLRSKRARKSVTSRSRLPFRFHIYGLTNRAYAVETSTNLGPLTNWYRIFTNYVSFWYTNLSASNDPQRFYRAITNAAGP